MSGRRPGDRERELVAALRAELAAVEPARPCCRAAELAGLGEQALGHARSPAIARLAVRLGPHPTPPPRAAATELAAFDWPSAVRHCRTAYLRGLFLAHGSLSLSRGATHLEFVVPAGEAPVLAARLADVDLPASWRVRRGRGVVTWKSAEQVVRFLRAAGAGPALLDLEARGVTRILRGELNRLSNADTANATRTILAAAGQMVAIRELAAAGRLAAERDVVRSVAAARLATPDATLGDLAAACGCTRATAQRALERLVRLAGTGPAARPSAASGTDRPAGNAPFGPVRGPPRQA